jgi:hypothetical protein
MKKLFITLSIVLILIGCGETRYNVSITNDSSKIVSYVYDGNSDTINVSETKNYEVKAYTQSPKNIIDGNGIASLKMDQKGDSFTFIDAIPFDLKVINELPVDITIKADNYIDNNGLMELTIVSNTENTGAKIYTKTPKFTSTSSYKLIYELVIIGNEISVIIR